MKTKGFSARRITPRPCLRRSAETTHVPRGTPARRPCARDGASAWLSWILVRAHTSSRGMNVRRLCVGRESLSRRFLLALALGVIAVFPGAADVQGDAPSTSKVRFVEHSPAAFDAAHREGKPVFLLISAVWCYWCKYFEQQVLTDAEVSKYLNQHYVSVFADHDRRVRSEEHTSELQSRPHLVC